MTKQVIRKKRPKKESSWNFWKEEELKILQSEEFLTEFYNCTVEDAKIIVTKFFPERTYDSIRFKIKHLNDKKKK